MAAIFTFTSRLDGLHYSASWDLSSSVLRVMPAAPAASGASVWGGPPSPPQPVSPYNPPVPDRLIVAAFEEGRLSHPNEECPYPRRAETMRHATAWEFGRLFNNTGD